MASFNWSDYKQAADDAGFSVIPASTYDATVKKAEAKKTGTGKDKISVQFIVDSGPMSGRSVFNDFVLSPENGTALGFFFRHMKALGLGPEYFATNPELGKVATDLVGRSCQIEVGIRLWNEEERNEIKGIKSSTGGTATPSVMKGPAAPQPMPQPQAAPQPQTTPKAQPQPAPQPASAAAPQPEPAVEDVKSADADAPPEMPF